MYTCIMVSVLAYGYSSPGLSRSGQGRYVVFLGKHLTLTVPFSVQVYLWVPANLKLEGNLAMD